MPAVKKTSAPEKGLMPPHAHKTVRKTEPCGCGVYYWSEIKNGMPLPAPGFDSERLRVQRCPTHAGLDQMCRCTASIQNIRCPQHGRIPQ